MLLILVPPSALTLAVRKHLSTLLALVKALQQEQIANFKSLPREHFPKSISLVIGLYFMLRLAMPWRPLQERLLPTSSSTPQQLATGRPATSLRYLIQEL